MVVKFAKVTQFENCFVREHSGHEMYDSESGNGRLSGQLKYSILRLVKKINTVYIRNVNPCEMTRAGNSFRFQIDYFQSMRLFPF